jgi:tetrahydromethanopterin S-methyltransferase subunit H
MFSFTKEQKTLNISGIQIGGQPGHHPTVLFGGLFFKGTPDLASAQTTLAQMFSLSEKTMVPAIPDFFIKKETYIDQILDFIEKNVPKKHPFSIDIIDPALKIIILKKIADRDLLKRTIYNSIHIGTTAEEQKTLEKYTPTAAIIVAFNPKDRSPDGKIEVLENGAHLTEHGLLRTVEQLGIENILLDTAALAPGENSGAAIAALPVIKEEYGLPTGCAIHNVVEKSLWLNDFPDARRIVDAASNLNIPLFSGDFAIFGPVENAPLIFPLIAWQDILISEYTEAYFGVSPADHHPRRKLSK